WSLLGGADWLVRLGCSVVGAGPFLVRSQGFPLSETGREPLLISESPDSDSDDSVNSDSDICSLPVFRWASEDGVRYPSNPGVRWVSGDGVRWASDPGVSTIFPAGLPSPTAP